MLKVSSNLFRKYAIKHEVAHGLQNLVEAASKGGFGEELKTVSKKWYSKWNNLIKKIRQKRIYL
jgi:hypothetical protein